MPTVTPKGASVDFSLGVGEAISNVITPYNITHADTYSYQFSNGTGTGKIDLAAYTASVNLGAGGTSTIDFTSYTDQFGNTVSTLTKIKALWIRNTGTVTVRIGGAATNTLVGAGFLTSATHTFDLVAGQVFTCVVPVGITVSSSVKNLLLTNTDGGTAASLSIIVTGSSS